MIESAFPIIATPDLERALGFYRDGLGGIVTYQFPPEGDPEFVALQLGTSELGLGREPDRATGGDQQRISLWVYVDDCDAAVEQLRSAGGAVVEPPADQPWGERLARVHDPDGNLVLIGARLG